jgi:hypothetical protein
MTNPKRDIFNIIWDHIAPVRKDEVEMPIDSPTVLETLEQVKLKHDAELSKMEADADYLEKKRKLQARIDAVTPTKNSILDRFTKPTTTTDSRGKRQNNSPLARFWRMIPLKPVVLPMAFVGVILLLVRAC